MLGRFNEALQSAADVVSEQLIFFLVLFDTIFGKYLNYIY